MTIADEARDNAIPCEMVLYAYRKSGTGIVVSFVVHPDDMPTELAVAPIGSRWVGALVRVGDDELPISPTAKGIKTYTANNPPAKLQPDTDKHSAGAKQKLDWREVQPAAQAGIRCGEAVFQKFLYEMHGDTFRRYSLDAAATVRFICGVNSRSELGTKHAARMIWKQLDDEYQAWKALEHA